MYLIMDMTILIYSGSFQCIQHINLDQVFLLKS